MANRLSRDRMLGAGVPDDIERLEVFLRATRMDIEPSGSDSDWLIAALLSHDPQANELSVNKITEEHALRVAAVRLHGLADSNPAKWYIPDLSNDKIEALLTACDELDGLMTAGELPPEWQIAQHELRSILADVDPDRVG